MLNRNDFDPEALEKLILEELISQLDCIKVDPVFPEDNEVLRDAFHRVIAYNSVPSTYEEGKYDNVS